MKSEDTKAINEALLALTEGTTIADFEQVVERLIHVNLAIMLSIYRAEPRRGARCLNEAIVPAVETGLMNFDALSDAEKLEIMLNGLKRD